jgi:hypothetical protein
VVAYLPLQIRIVGSNPPKDHEILRASWNVRTKQTRLPPLWVHCMQVVQRRHINIIITRGISVTKRAGTPFRRLLEERKLERRSGTFSCHMFHEVRRVLRSNRPSFKQSSYFVQYLKQKLTPPPPCRLNFGHSMRSGSFFFKNTKSSPATHIWRRRRGEDV